MDNEKNLSVDDFYICPNCKKPLNQSGVDEHGNIYFSPHQCYTCVASYWLPDGDIHPSKYKPTTPAPLSEQKQEGETHPPVIPNDNHDIHYISENGLQPFEAFPDLADCLLHAASFWKVDGRWSETLSRINDVAIMLLQEREFRKSQNGAKQIEEAAYQIDCLEHDKGELIKELDRTNADMIYCENACNAAKEDLADANKQIDQYKARIVELEEKLSGIETKHQEELANYNSYAASHVEEQFENKIEELAEWLERDKQVAIGMMGELANPAVVVYDTCISRLKAINID